MRITDDVAGALAAQKPGIALYVGGMGAREVNFHNEHMRRMGYADAAEQIQELFLAGRKDEAIAAVPDEYVDERCLVGPAERIRERYGAWADSGITEPRSDDAPARTRSSCSPSAPGSIRRAAWSRAPSPEWTTNTRFADPADGDLADQSVTTPWRPPPTSAPGRAPCSAGMTSSANRRMLRGRLVDRHAAVLEHEHDLVGAERLGQLGRPRDRLLRRAPRVRVEEAAQEDVLVGPQRGRTSPP